MKLKHWMAAAVWAFFCVPAGAEGIFNAPGRSAYEAGDYAKARDIFAQELRKDPADADAAYGLGNSLYRLGQYQDASNAYQQALEANPRLEQGWYNLGNSLYKQGDYADAAQVYQRALSLDHKDRAAFHNLQLSQSKAPAPTPAESQERERASSSGQRGGPRGTNPGLQKLLSNSLGGKPLPPAPGPLAPGPLPTATLVGTQVASPHGTPVAAPTGTPVENPKGTPVAAATGTPRWGPQGTPVVAEGTPTPGPDERRQAQARQELGLSDAQVQQMLEAAQKQERQTQQYFSLNPKKDAQDDNSMWGMLPKEQREMMRRIFGKTQDDKNQPEEDW
ncbi:MAG TPA: tetratricopeptide repeat protein [bacterium]|nr:tetratricopeptide repeat protein [bacterium]